MGLRFDQYANAPGVSAAVETLYEGELKWGRGMSAVYGAWTIDGTTRDAASTNTVELGCGLVLGQIASSGNLRDYGDANTDGSDVVVGVLIEGVRITDYSNTNVKKFWGILLGGPVKAGKLRGLTEQARAQMAGRFIFDDRAAIPAFWGWARTIAKTADYTVVNGTDAGTQFTTTGASGAVNFTLPTTLKKGQKWLFTNTVNQNMTVTAPSGKLVTYNNATATSVAFSTSSQKIGGAFEIMVDDTAAKYIALPHGANTVTVA